MTCASPLSRRGVLFGAARRDGSQLKPKPGRRAEGCELSPDRQQEYCVKGIERLIKKLELDKQILETKYLPTLTMMTRPHLMRLIPAKLAYNVVSLFVPSLGEAVFGYPYG
jgi:hypothetical protein